MPSKKSEVDAKVKAILSGILPEMDPYPFLPPTITREGLQVFTNISRKNYCDRHPKVDEKTLSLKHSPTLINENQGALKLSEWIKEEIQNKVNVHLKKHPPKLPLDANTVTAIKTSVENSIKSEFLAAKRFSHEEGVWNPESAGRLHSTTYVQGYGYKADHGYEPDKKGHSYQGYIYKALDNITKYTIETNMDLILENAIEERKKEGVENLNKVKNDIIQGIIQISGDKKELKDSTPEKAIIEFYNVLNITAKNIDKVQKDLEKKLIDINTNYKNKLADLGIHLKPEIKDLREHIIEFSSKLSDIQYKELNVLLNNLKKEIGKARADAQQKIDGEINVCMLEMKNCDRKIGSGGPFQKLWEYIKDSLYSIIGKVNLKQIYIKSTKDLASTFFESKSKFKQERDNLDSPDPTSKGKIP